VADVTSDINSVVTTDGTGGRCQRVGGAEENASSLNSVSSFPNHGADRSREHVIDQAREEWLVRKVRVVLLEVLLAGGDELDGSKFVSPLLKTRDDGTNKPTLDAIRLDGNESLLRSHCYELMGKN